MDGKMKKVVRFCLALVMMGSVTSTAFAGEKEFSLYGRVRAYVEQNSTKAGSADAKNKLDMKADGRLGATAVTKGDVWTTKAVAHYAVDEAASFTARDLYVEVSKEDLLLRFGRYYATDVYAWTSYGDKYDANLDIGSGVDGGDRWTGLRVGLPEVGVTVDAAINFGGSESDTYTHSTDATGDVITTKTAAEGTYTRTDLHVRYDKTYDNLTVGASYHNRSESVDDKNGGVKGGSHDGNTASSIGLAVKYTMNDNMAILGGLDSYNRKANKDADTLAGLIINFCFDYGFGDGSGVGITLTSAMNEEDKDTKKNTLAFAIGYSRDFAGVGLNIGFMNSTDKLDSSGAEENKSTTLGAKVQYSF